MIVNVQSFLNILNQIQALIVETNYPAVITIMEHYWLNQQGIEQIKIGGNRIASAYCRTEYNHGSRMVPTTNDIDMKQLNLEGKNLESVMPHPSNCNISASNWRCRSML